MAEQLKVKDADLTSYEFQGAMIALINDYLDITPQKDQEILSILEEGKETSSHGAYKTLREYKDKYIVLL